LGRRYVLGEELGRGGVGVVYVGYDLEARRSVAIKVLRPEHTDDDEALARFEQEARIARQISHENVARVYDFGRDGDSRYLVLELLGPTLKDLLKERKRIPAGSAARIMSQVLAGLGAAHRAGIVHRDVKPQNVLFAVDSGQPAVLQVKVVDFGIARIIGGRSHTAAGRFFGTAYYVSPEQASGQQVGPASDLYSAGVVLYELLTGEVPFNGESDLAILRKHVEEAPRPPSKIASEVPPRLEAVVLRALEKQPERRWPDASAMRAALASYDTPAGQPLAAAATRPFLLPSKVILPPNEREKQREKERDSRGAPAVAPNGSARSLLGRLRSLLRGSAKPPVRQATVPLATVTRSRPATSRDRPAADRDRSAAPIGFALLLLAAVVLGLALGGVALSAAPFGAWPTSAPTTPATATRAVPGGASAQRVALPSDAFDGGCLDGTLPAKVLGGTLILGQSSTCPRAVAQFDLADKPRAGATLRLTALASPLEAPEVAVLLNDRQVFKGRLALPQDGGPGEASLPVPDGTLRTGRNRLEIRNLASGAQPEVGPWLALFSGEIGWR
jgi:serine/threonine-protein kinase